MSATDPAIDAWRASFFMLDLELGLSRAFAVRNRPRPIETRPQRFAVERDTMGSRSDDERQGVRELHLVGVGVLRIAAPPLAVDHGARQLQIGMARAAGDERVEVEREDARAI